MIMNKLNIAGANKFKNLQMAKMGSKYGQKWPDLDFTNGHLNGQLSVLYSALKWSNLEKKIAWRMC